MKKPASILSILCAGCVFLAAAAAPGCGEKGRADRLTLYVAASLTDAIQETAEVFEAKNGIEITCNFGGSGSLAQQILAAPRADLFLSASQKWMNAVAEGDRVAPGTRQTLLSNSLVVIANPDAPWSVKAPEEIAGLPFEHLSIGDPDSVPAGQYAKTWMESVKSAGGGSLWDQVKDRISPAPDVRAALAQVEGSADVIGVVYRTDYAARRDAVRLLYEIPREAGPKIEYPIASIKEAENEAAARAFLAFLTGPEAAEIFRKHGFLPLPAE